MSDATQLQHIAISQLEPHPNNPRLARKKGEETIRRLAGLIKARSFDAAHAPIVRPYKDQYQIVSGHRRVEAAKRAGLTDLPCWIRDMDDEDAHRLLLEENVQDPLHPIEEGAHYLSSGLTQEAYSKRMGISREALKHKIAAAKVYATISEQHSLEEAGAHWRALAALRPAQQWLWPLWGALLVTEGWTMKATEEKVAKAGRADRPPAWLDAKLAAAGLASGAIRPQEVLQAWTLVTSIKDKAIREQVIEELTKAPPASSLGAVKQVIYANMPRPPIEPSLEEAPRDEDKVDETKDAVVDGGATLDREEPRETTPVAGAEPPATGNPLNDADAGAVVAFADDEGEPHVEPTIQQVTVGDEKPILCSDGAPAPDQDNQSMYPADRPHEFEMDALVRKLCELRPPLSPERAFHLTPFDRRTQLARLARPCHQWLGEFLCYLDQVGP